MRRLISVLILCLMPFCAYAAPLQDAERDILAGKAAQAVVTLEKFHPATRAETLRHLWALGLAYNRTGRFGDAVKPLSRLVALVPDNPDFRLELAGTLLQVNQSERALYHLELAKASPLPAPVAARVQDQINALRRPDRWQGYLRFALIPESNAARRTAAEAVTINGLVFGIVSKARQQPANGGELGFGLARLPRLSANLRARFGLDLQARIFDARANDDITLRANLALLHFDAEARQSTLELIAANRWIDGANFTNTTGANLGYALALGPRTRLSANLTYEVMRYAQGGFDVSRTAADVQLTHAATAQLVLRAAARLEHRASPFANAAGHASGLTVGADYAIRGGLRLGLDLSCDDTQFNGIHPLFGQRRLDQKLATTLSLTNQNWSYNGFAPVLRLGHERQTSTIPLNAFQNLSASIGFTRSF